MRFRLAQEFAADAIPVAIACWILNVSTSGHYDWASRPPSPRSVAEAELTMTIRPIYGDSRATYGALRVLAELHLGLGVHVGRKRVARLMRTDELVGVSRRRKRHRWEQDTVTREDLVSGSTVRTLRIGCGSAISHSIACETDGSTAPP